MVVHNATNLQSACILDPGVKRIKSPVIVSLFWMEVLISKKKRKAKQMYTIMLVSSFVPSRIMYCTADNSVMEMVNVLYCRQ